MAESKKCVVRVDLVGFERAFRQAFESNCQRDNLDAAQAFVSGFIDGWMAAGKLSFEEDVNG